MPSRARGKEKADQGNVMPAMVKRVFARGWRARRLSRERRVTMETIPIM